MEFLQLFKKAPKEKAEEEEVSQNEGPENEEEDLESDEELLQAVKSDARFQAPDFAPLDYLFSQLPPNFDEHWLAREIKRRERQRELVEAHLADRVIKSYSAFVQGMAQVQQVGSDLNLAAFLCKAARLKLSSTKSAMTKTCFSVLRSHKQTCVIEQVISTLTTMQSITDVENRVRHAANQGDFTGAVEMCLECQRRTVDLSSFVAARGLAGRIRTAYSSVQRSLDAALRDSCRQFDPVRYKSAVLAYRLIGKSSAKSTTKSDRLMERLQRHWLTTLHGEALAALQPHVPAQGATQAHSTAKSSSEAQASHFREICKTLSQESLPACLTDLLHRLTLLLFTMHKVCFWHKAETSTYFSDIYQGLERFRKTLWGEMQRKVSALLSTADFAALQLDPFLQILSVLEQFAEIGDSFSSSSSLSLLASIKKQSKDFFLREHKRRLEDLPAILEAETWVRMPLNANFGALDIKEFKDFMKKSGGTKAEAKTAGFEWYVNNGSPFAPSSDNDEEESTSMLPNGDARHSGEAETSREEEVVDPALYASFVDEGDGASEDLARPPPPLAEEGPIVASSGIHFLQYIGKYLLLMVLLRPISFEIFVGVTHLFQYYVYSVYSFFAKEKEDPESNGNSGLVSMVAGVMAATGVDTHHEETPGRHLHPLLAACLARIRTQLIHQPGQEKRKFAIDEAKMSAAVDKSFANAAGLAERVVAAETLSFMHNVLYFAKNRLGSLLPKQQEQHFVKFYRQTVDMLPHLKIGIYKCAAFEMLRFGGFPAKISACKWDIKDLGVDHNDYINTMINEFKQFKTKMENLRRRGYLPEDPYNAVIQVACGHVVETLIDGFSRVRKCTFEGRGLMKLDFQTLQAGLKRILLFKSLPDAERLDAFISAFYEPETSLLQWFRTHYNDYTHKQLVGLATALPIKRKQRSEILQLLSDLEKERRTTAIK